MLTQARTYGYDRTDPSNPHFLVKDSYGFVADGEDGFRRFGYDQLSGILAASYITAIRPTRGGSRDPTADSAPSATPPARCTGSTARSAATG